MKNISQNKSLVTMILFVSALVFVFATLVFTLPHNAGATAPAGLNAQVASSSVLTVGPGNNTYAMGTTTNESRYQCAARLVSTVGQPVMISFASLSSTTLSQTVGFLQAASTTVAYDGGLYGCGYMTVRGLNASTTITIAETH